MIELSHDDWRLDVSPQIGGAISRLTWRGLDILRPAPAGSSDALLAGCFPLVPYANRIARGRFDWRGKAVELAVSPRFAPHALHGDGWTSPWTIGAGQGASVTLTHRPDPGTWPWPYEARQTFTLSDDGLRVDLSVTNVGDDAMPAGLGLHPYFPVTPETRLTLDASSVWARSDHEIPTALVPAAEVFDWTGGRPVVPAPFVDHCYAGWGGRARLDYADRTVTITASPKAAWAHVYAPKGEGYCCVEPVTHRPDAIHAPPEEDSGLTALAPGGALSMWMRIAAKTAVESKT